MTPVTALLDPAVLSAKLLEASDRELILLKWQLSWIAKARVKQLPPRARWLIWMITSGRGFGKALALDTVINTPNGPRTMGQLEDGDLVYAADGSETRVVRAHPPYEAAEVYRLILDTHEEIIADADHLWECQSYPERKKSARHETHVSSIRTTRDVHALVSAGKYVSLPVCGVLGEEKSLPFDPYALGVWLGDGSSSGCSFATWDPEIAERVGERVPLRFVKVEGIGGKVYSFELGRLPSAGGGHFSRGVAQEIFRDLGLFKNKHVPEVYLQASREQRLELLRGLMDTDGSINKDGTSLGIGFVSFQLANDVFRLVSSLGIKARWYYRVAKMKRDDGSIYQCDFWCVSFVSRADTPVFKLRRKLERQIKRGAQAQRQTSKVITSVERVEPQLVRCITVSHPSSLYLVGDGYVPTHNTLSGAQWLGWAAANDEFDDLDNQSFVVAPTYDDVKLTCFEGPTGLLSVIPPELILEYNKGTPEIVLDNGGIIRGYTAREPDRLRGPQCRRAWCEEIGSWLYDVETWDNLVFGCRLGDNPQIAVTSTPKPRPLVNQLYKDKSVVLVRGSTYENKDNLAKVFLERVLKYEGTKLGRQEIHGELIDPEESGVIKRSQFKLWPHDRPQPEFVYIILSLDTAFTEKTRDNETGDPDPTACSVWGIFHETVTLDSFRGKAKKVALPSIMLLDAWEDFLGFPDLVTRVKEERKARYGTATKPVLPPQYGVNRLEDDGRKPDLILIEDKGSGRSLRQSLEADGIQAYPYNPTVDKLARLHQVSPLFARSRVWTIESAKMPGQPRPWADGLITQACTFRGDGTIAHDDLLDTMTQALIVATDFGLLRAVDFNTFVKEQQEKFENNVQGIPEDDLAERAAKRAAERGHRVQNPYAR